VTISSYLRHPDVPAVRIGAYPKRRAGSMLIGLPAAAPAAARPAVAASVDASATYADFFRQDDRIAI
jgi:hypothetical protein